MKAYEDSLDNLISIGKRLNRGMGPQDQAWAANAVSSADAEIETKWKLGALSNGEYQNLHGCVMELKEDLRHIKNITDLRRKYGYAAFADVINDFLDI